MKTLAIASISLLLASCASVPSVKHAEGPELPAAIVHELALGKASRMFGYADLDAVRRMIDLKPEFEKPLLEVVDLRIEALDGVSTLAFYYDERDIELALFSCKTLADTTRLAETLNATWVDSATGIKELEQMASSGRLAYRMSDLCVATLSHGRIAKFWPELMAVQERLASLPARESEVAHISGVVSEFPWILYNLLVKGSAREPEGLMKALGIGAWAKACRHVESSFKNGADHCQAIPEFEVSIHRGKTEMTWELGYTNPELRTIMWKAITSMPRDTADGIGLDTSGSSGKDITLRHRVPLPLLTQASLEMILRRKSGK